MPPAFSRAERHLADAWKNHHTADHDGTLLSCYKAFECLGFDLYGDDAVTRRKLVEQLLEGVEPQKIAAVEDLMKSLQGFFHLGRHDRSAPVTLTHLDSQLAVACATIVMSYLAPQHKPVE